MGVHPKDINAANPRMQCSVCGKWKRLDGVEIRNGKRVMFSRFHACGYGNGDHLAGDHGTVCEECCQTACREIYEAKQIKD